MFGTMTTPPFPMVKGDYFTGLTPAGIIRCGRVHDLEGTLDEMGEQLVAPAQGL